MRRSRRLILPLSVLLFAGPALAAPLTDSPASDGAKPTSFRSLIGLNSSPAGTGGSVIAQVPTEPRKPEVSSENKPLPKDILLPIADSPTANLPSQEMSPPSQTAYMPLFPSQPQSSSIVVGKGAEPALKSTVSMNRNPLPLDQNTPEPASVGLLAVATIFMLRRRGKNKRNV